MTSGDSIELPAAPEALSAARRFLHDKLDPEATDATARDVLVFAVNELVTNAILHAHTAVRVTISQRPPDTVHVDVVDHSSELPARAAETTSTPARGLAIIGELGLSWGATPLDDGKRVWVEMETGSRPAG